MAGAARRGIPGTAGSLAAAVLAGGASRRMGRDKATMPVGGVELARRAIGAAARLAAPVIVVAPEGHPAAALASAAGAGWVADPGRGPLEALVSALRAVDAPYLLLLAADHPLLRPELLDLLVAERARWEAVACRRGPRLEPLVAVYERAAALKTTNVMLERGADRSLRGLLGALRTRVIEEPEWRRVDPEGASFVDLDDPADLAAFLDRPGGEGPPTG
jgi:molybdopterin-guanine dinucleotide biosynthesis protein A